MPNGSRLSWGSNAGGRKRPVLGYLQAGAQTDAASESRRRQLQALVRRLPLRGPGIEFGNNEGPRDVMAGVVGPEPQNVQRDSLARV